MLPLLLAQLEHVDIDGLIRTLIGAGGGAAIAGLIVRQWALGRLHALASLERSAKRDAVRWKLLARYMKSQAGEQNRQRFNAHQLRNATGIMLFAIEQLAEASHMKIRLPTREELEEKWSKNQLEPFTLELEDEDDEQPEDD